jgi:putative Mn2+ efflux pump MntP
MHLVESLLLSFALGVDAMAVAFAVGLAHPDKTHRPGLTLALWFGGFQALMSFLGFILTQYVSFISQWAEKGAGVVFIILGLKLFWDAWQDTDDVRVPQSHHAYFLLALATSIDAFAAGIALTEKRSAYITISLIGIVAFVMTWMGAITSQRMKHLPEKYLEIIGSLILIFLGVKSLL